MNEDIQALLEAEINAIMKIPNEGNNFEGAIKGRKVNNIRNW